MAYYNTMWEDAHKDYSTRRPITNPTFGSITGNFATPHASLPIDPSPRSRPFRAFEDSVATPPPDSARLGTPSRAEQEYKAFNEAWGARQREIYAMPGVGELTDEMRSWNGRIIRPPPPSRLERLFTVITIFAPVLGTILAVAGRAILAEAVRSSAAARTRLSLRLSWAHYHILRLWRLVAIELGFIFERVRLVTLLMIIIWAMVIAILQLAAFMGADPRPGRVVYTFVSEPRSWSVVAY
ncbi:hypothetical protein F4859DRAFT_101607 [Xylaria cf. heliscus]|nr:hypothetical protein F4859DRAFT_101607 [Xylaria cf. heliscus]